MKFSELNKQAQNVAIADYIRGWKETHEDETLTNTEARRGCIDTEDDVEYDKEPIDTSDIFSVKLNKGNEENGRHKSK